MKRPPRYRKPPASVYRKLELGIENNGYVKVIAGFTFKWWDPEAIPVPLFVNARITKDHRKEPVT